MLIMMQIRLLMVVSVVWSSFTLLSKESHRPPSDCRTKQHEQQWYHYLSNHFFKLFPKGNRNFGGYKWFRLTYSNKDFETNSFIQPSKYGVDGEMDSWMIERFAIDKMEYDFSEIDQDQYLTFLSPQATQEIVGYLSQNESFSIATLSNNAWYAGTFIPIKSIKDFEKLAILNPKTFCKTISYDYIQQQRYQDLKISTEKLVEDLSYANLRCDNNFNLKK